MNEKKIQRKWALVLAVLFTLAAVRQLIDDGINISDSYGVGSLVGTFFFPALFYYLAFKKKRK